MKWQEHEDLHALFVSGFLFVMLSSSLLTPIHHNFYRKSKKNERTSTAEPREADRSSSNNARKDMQELSRLFAVDTTDLKRASRTEVATDFEFSTLLSTTTSTNNEGAIFQFSLVMF